MTNLTREEFLRVQRGEDTHRHRVWNGMIHIKTPPKRPNRPVVDSECQLFDFLLPYPIQVFDDDPWTALHVQRDDIELLLLKPSTLDLKTTSKLGTGNEEPDIQGTCFPAIIPMSAACYPAGSNSVFRFVERATQWIRILTRQYWIGAGSVGVSAQYRASVFRVENSGIYQRNCAQYGQAAIAKPLVPDVWEQLIRPVQFLMPVPVDQVLFCDALLSFARQDTITSMIHLGVSAEVAITNMLDDLAGRGQGTKAEKAYVKARQNRKDNFANKLNRHASALGMSDPSTFSVDGAPDNWAAQVESLYQGRNKAAHEGRPMVKDTTTGKYREINLGELQDFIFSVEALFCWIAYHRELLLDQKDLIEPLRMEAIVSRWGDSTSASIQTSEAHSPVA